MEIAKFHFRLRNEKKNYLSKSFEENSSNIIFLILPRSSWEATDTKKTETNINVYPSLQKAAGIITNVLRYGDIFLTESNFEPKTSTPFLFHYHAWIGLLSD